MSLLQDKKQKLDLQNISKYVKNETVISCFNCFLKFNFIFSCIYVYGTCAHMHVGFPVEAKVNVRGLPRLLVTLFIKSWSISRTQSSLMQQVQYWLFLLILCFCLLCTGIKGGSHMHLTCMYVAYGKMKPSLSSCEEHFSY